jgi:hypothetical protein
VKGHQLSEGFFMGLLGLAVVVSHPGRFLLGMTVAGIPLLVGTLGQAPSQAPLRAGCDHPDVAISYWPGKDGSRVKLPDEPDRSACPTRTRS